MRASIGKRKYLRINAGRATRATLPAFRNGCVVISALRRWRKSRAADSVIRQVKTLVTIRTIRQADALSIRQSRYQNVSIFNGGVQVSVPSNWRQIDDGNSVWFAPEGGYGQYNGQAVFTHGASFGVAQTNNRNLQRATES